MANEQRREKRRHLVYYLPVYRRGESTLLGRLADLTETGFMLMCDRPVAPETDHALQIRSETELSAVAKVDVDARCRWCRRGDHDGFDVGFEFLDQKLKEARAIGALIADLGLSDT